MQHGSDSVARRARSTTDAGVRDELERALCRVALARLPRVAMAVVLPSGSEVAVHPGPWLYRLRLHSHRALLRFLWPSTTALGDLFAAGDLTVEGDLVSLLVEANRFGAAAVSASGALARLRAASRRIGERRAARNARHHYALGADFFAAWLDPTLTYTCAYFADDAMTLAEAQVAKMDLVCRKLRLRSGERVIEAGCGWGGLALHMARHHGVRVRAFNVSEEQVAWARERAGREGLGAQVEFVVDDYRGISGEADAFVSVGMLEHVGPRHYAELGAIVARTIGEAGRAFVHTIGRVRQAPTDAWIDRRIFPGGYTPSLGEMASLFEPNDLAVVHVENLRRDYALTLGHWLCNFAAATVSGALGAHDDAFLRTWHLYLASSQAAFLTGWAQLYQLLLVSRRNTTFRGPGRC